MKRFNGKYNGFAIELKFANIEMQYVLSFYYKKSCLGFYSTGLNRNVIFIEEERNVFNVFSESRAFYLDDFQYLTLVLY